MHFSVNDRISFPELSQILSNEFAVDSKSFTLNGSLLDYRMEEHASILSCEFRSDGVEYEIDTEWPESFSEDKESTEKSRLKDTFLRAGISSHPNIEEVMGRLREQDDVIIGIDTNVLWDCLFTSYLLEEIYAEPFPNWILIAIPRLVMAETENAANSKIKGGDHPRLGWPTYNGRVGHRALQETMEIRERDPDRPGLAMMSVGDMGSGARDINQANWRLDSMIRNQFQMFLDDINFHKGTFFLSQDRVNVMMSGTEGSQGLYLQKPELESFDSGTISIDEVARLVFELSIQFGGVTLTDQNTDTELSLDVFWPGKQVTDWQKGLLNISAIEHDSR